MLNITDLREENVLKIALDGRLDTTTAPELEALLGEKLTDATELVFDLEKLEYISSAGLRVLLSAQKQMNRQGEMKLRGVSDTIMEIFEITGFCDILTFE